MIMRLSNDSALSVLSVSVGELDQIFQPTLFDYTAMAGFVQTTVTVTAEANYPNADVTINGRGTSSGRSVSEIALAEGVNSITVTVTAEDGVTTSTYTVLLTRQTINNFAQQAYIKASNPEVDDELAWRSVALHGDTLAVGAFGEDSSTSGINGDEADNSFGNSGAVYVFTRDTAGTWSQQAYLKASNTDAGDFFGWALALYGDTLAVGAYGEDSASIGIDGDQTSNSANDSGAVYVFTRDSAGSWTQQAYLKASNTDPGDSFGATVALYGSTLAVGAYGEDSAATGVNGDQSDNSVNDSGAVYVFASDSSGDWTQQAYIKASNRSAGFAWGSISLFEDTLAVGALFENSGATGINGDQENWDAPNSGAVYVFTRENGGTWGQQAYVKASNTAELDLFGRSVAVYEDTLAVGARLEDSGATGINGDQGDDLSLENTGAVYVFTRDALGTWSQQAYVKASNTGLDDQFGLAVALHGNNLAVGAYWEDSAATGTNGDQANNDALRAGAVYLFTRSSAGTWSQIAYVKASNTDAGDLFGESVALYGDTLAVGAPGEASAAADVDGDQASNAAPKSGAVYIFK